MSLNIDYPNPVLSIEGDDYNDGCSFDISFKEEDIIVDENNICINAKCELKCNGLSELIRQGKAAIVVLIYSSAASYRRAFEFNATESAELTKVIKIPKFDVKRNIEFCGYILAKEDIKSFRCDGEFNDIYFREISFTVRKADVLAQGQMRTIPIDDSELEKPISSIFSIRKNTHSEAEIEANFDIDEKIVVYLSERLNQLFYDIKDFNNGALHRYLNGIVVYPVLVEGIAKIYEHYQNDDSGYSEKRWFKAIEYKLQGMGVNLEEGFDDRSYVELADKLLGGIAYDGLISMKNTIDEETNNGEYVNTGGVD
ncbi:MAG: hypothetical protein HDT32_03570 [Clostridiales bacterium]|nr:hypothetical protein [Clostridiales bacterium]